ncbi:MAG TPA: ABC transporter permease [Acidobacteriota bacterium]
MRFELFVALRYLKAKRKQAVISVITAISVLGVAAGVMALVIALALNTGFQVELQAKILGATSHITVLQSDGRPLKEFRAVVEKIRNISGVQAITPTIYGQVFFVGGLQNQGVQLKGIDLGNAQVPEILKTVVSGNLSALSSDSAVPGIIIGRELARKTGTGLNSVVRAISSEGELSPVGKLPRSQTFKVVAVFESGLWDFDANWVFVTLDSARRLFHLSPEQVTALEVNLRDIYQAGQAGRAVEEKLGEGYQALTWIELNRPLFSALRLEKLAMFIAIGLIVLVASLNVVTTLTMMVIEKQKDIAILSAMGSDSRIIMWIFMLQGIIIGIIGTVIGMGVGVTASWWLNRYKVIHLQPDVYSIPFVPFHTRWEDVLAIAMVAMLITFLATLHPARAASRLDPVEALRYE